ncbi:MAG: hypothetical protein JWR40_169 [Massilia sp.]|jgi:hypothetical protein|nr:hypothetical protein [Massilia sp.]MDB5948349.1 hypothetical protein [Massilia sp.]
MFTRSRDTPMRNTVKAGAAYFGLVFGAGFLLGAVRVPFLVPRFGERVAELLEMPVQFIVIVFAARFVVRRFAVPAAAPSRLRVGFLALGLAIAAELLLAAALTGGQVGAYLAARDPVSGSVYLVMLLVFALLPLVAGRGAA